MKTDFPFICFDTEDDSEELGKQVALGIPGASMFDKRVTQIAAITASGKRYYNAGDVPAFLKWVLAESKEMVREYGACYLYALNVGYDMGNLFADCLDELDCTLIGGRIIKGQWGPIKLVDVWNIWQCSVKKLGEVFELAKLETKDMANDKEYVFRDVEIIREAMLYAWRFADEIGLGNVPPTMGSFGVNLWKSWGGQTVHHSGEMTREAIYGGRVEIFKPINSEQVAYCDINSLYPFVMTKEFPGELENTGTELKKFGIAQVTLDIPEREIMVLPWRSPEGKIFYPFGKITGVWTIAEIRAAEKRGAKILAVHDALSTDESISPYRDYVTRIYLRRKASKSKVEKNFYKLLMNTLYGRTGTQGIISRTVELTERTMGKGIEFGRRTLIDYAMPLPEEVNWSHSAYITAYGRLELLKYLEKIGADKLIYCDTDSVIFDCPGEIPFPTGNELGEMKIEQRCSVCGMGWHPDKLGKCEAHSPRPLDRWEGCIAWAPKQYKLDGEYKAKGVPKNKQKEFVEKGRAEYSLPFKYREAIAFYDRGNSKKLSVWRSVVKENRVNYDKKTLRAGRFFPLRIDDE